ncbi:hypothetical protein SAMN04489761_2923 [Tenacibaculum sp. MAR_2009_124]|uniref:hypothetical protein n=1 Tax=Tenacibaculum sp. MAR_2009_124 TaxID=1250059 RepID=UPI00089D96ED|nr:hypothetical protein [Tenacibaculum sp. MAR_2009_124]SEC41278.1 hypothetical protein SAMN04489761_2923 [Tenacibaculum sp. MAR_2009_124]
MLKSIYNLGNALNKAQMKSINGSARSCNGDYCWSGVANGLPICVPCGEEEPPKK